MRRALPLVLFALVGTVASAAPVLVFEDTNLSGGRICVHHAAPDDDPAAAFLGGSEATCFDLAENPAFPEGEWSAWAEHPDGFVSRDRLLFRDGVLVPETQEIVVVPAARVDPGDPPRANERQVFWLPSTGAVIARPDGAHELLLPERRAWPITIRGGHVFSYGDVILPTREKKMKVGGVKRGVAALLRFDDVWLRRYEEIRPALPEIEIAFGRMHEASRESIERYEPGMATLLLFPPLTGGEIRLGGAGWKSVVAPVVDSDGALFVEAPIMATPTSRLTVRWFSREDLTTAEASSLYECRSLDGAVERGELSEAGDENAPATLVLLDCPRAQPGWSAERVASSSCEEAGLRSLAEEGTGGEVVFEDVEPGLHVVRLDNGRLPSLYRLAEVSSGETVVDVDLDYYKVFGKVTRRNDPVHVYLAWAFGRAGYAVTNPADGEYTMILASKPTSASIPIEACDGSFSTIFIPDEAPPDNSRYDIELPDNEIIVSVIDAETGSPIEGAGVNLAAAQPGSETSAHFSGEFGKTDENGIFVLKDSPENRKLAVCATHEEYLLACETGLSTKDERSQGIELSLEKAKTTRGRVDVVGEIQHGVLMIFSVDGRIAEFTRLDGGGSFVLQQPHQNGEIVAFVSRSHPLYVFRYQVPDGELLIQPPPAPIRSIEVSLPETGSAEGGMLSISIGGIRVPFNAFSRHASLRRAQAALRPGQSTTVTDVLGTGSITVHFLPDRWLTTQPRSEADPMYWPGAASFRSFPLGAEGKVVLEGF